MHEWNKTWREPDRAESEINIKMSGCVLVGDGDEETSNKMELPMGEDGSLSLATLAASFPNASGLKYKNPKTGAFRGLRWGEWDEI